MTEPNYKLAAHRCLPTHLAQLAELLGRTVVASELMTLELTEEVRAQSKLVAPQPTWQQEIAFADRVGARFINLIKRLGEAHSVQVLIWTPLSNKCGLLHAVDLEAIKFGFQFDTIAEGIIVILTVDFMNKMVLDYSDDDLGNQRICVEVCGASWGRIAY